jgi:DNA-binding XRE family transcriptional regulator
MRPRDKAEISARFKGLRHLADMTQLCLGELIGIGRQAVWEIEHERTLPQLRTWHRFAILEARHLAEAGRTEQNEPWQQFSPGRHKKTT